MVNGNALIELGRNSTCMEMVTLGQIGMMGFRNRKPGDKDDEYVEGFDICDYDVLFTFTTTESVDVLMDLLAEMKNNMIWNKGEN